MTAMQRIQEMLRLRDSARGHGLFADPIFAGAFIGADAAVDMGLIDEVEAMTELSAVLHEKLEMLSAEVADKPLLLG
jgi:hypothetical protein